MKYAMMHDIWYVAQSKVISEIFVVMQQETARNLFLIKFEKSFLILKITIFFLQGNAFTFKVNRFSSTFPIIVDYRMLSDFFPSSKPLFKLSRLYSFVATKIALCSHILTHIDFLTPATNDRLNIFCGILRRLFVRQSIVFFSVFY